MLLLLPIFLVASFFGKVNGGNIIYEACRVWADIWMFLIGISHKNIYEVPHDTSRQYIFVNNHISYLDIPVMMKAIRRQNFRILGKAELAAIPVFGFIFKHAAVSVDRKNPEHRAKSVITLKSIIRRKISIYICPLSPGRSHTVFLEETNTAGLSISDVSFLKEKIYKQMEDGLIRYKASWIEHL